MLDVDDRVRELRKQEVHESREQAKSRPAKAGGAPAVAFLGSSVLGGVITALLVGRDANKKFGDEG